MKHALHTVIDACEQLYDSGMRALRNRKHARLLAVGVAGAPAVDVAAAVLEQLVNQPVVSQAYAAPPNTGVSFPFQNFEMSDGTKISGKIYVGTKDSICGSGVDPQGVVDSFSYTGHPGEKGWKLTGPLGQVCPDPAPALSQCVDLSDLDSAVTTAVIRHCAPTPAPAPPKKRAPPRKKTASERCYHAFDSSRDGTIGLLLDKKTAEEFESLFRDYEATGTPVPDQHWSFVGPVPVVGLDNSDTPENPTQCYGVTSGQMYRLAQVAAERGLINSGKIDWLKTIIDRLSNKVGTPYNINIGTQAESLSTPEEQKDLFFELGKILTELRTNAKAQRDASADINEKLDTVLARDERTNAVGVALDYRALRGTEFFPSLNGGIAGELLVDATPVMDLLFRLGYHGSPDSCSYTRADNSSALARDGKTLKAEFTQEERCYSGHELVAGAGFLYTAVGVGATRIRLGAGLDLRVSTSKETGITTSWLEREGEILRSPKTINGDPKGETAVQLSPHGRAEWQIPLGLGDSTVAPYVAVSYNVNPRGEQRGYTGGEAGVSVRLFLPADNKQAR